MASLLQVAGISELFHLSISIVWRAKGAVLQLFDDFERHDPTPKRNYESFHSFYNRISGEFWEQVREVYERWFQRLPAESQADISGRLRSDSQEQSSGAFWELYLHEQFNQLGFHVVCHPTVPGATNQPDFLLRNRGVSIYVEACVINEASDDEAEERLLAAVVDEVNKAQNPNFMLEFDPQRIDTSMPPTRKLRAELHRWLASLDVDEVREVMVQDSSLFNLPVCDWKHRDWHVVFRAIPLSPELRGYSRDRLIGIEGPVRGGFVDDYRVIRDRLERKAHPYRQLSEPLVLAVYSNRITTNEFEFKRALFGIASEYPEMMHSGEIGPSGSNSDEGLFIRRDGPRQHVSCVLTATKISPHNIVNWLPRAWRNPWASAPLPDSAFPYDLIDHDSSKNRLVLYPGKRSAASILDLPDGWPVGEPFPNQ